MSNTALIVTDVQYDMCDGGIMSNVNSIELIPKINSIKDDYKLVIYIIKCYKEGNRIFNNTNKHCIENTHGSQLHGDLLINKNDIIIKMLSNGSAFCCDEDNNINSQLLYLLQVNEINTLHFCGNNCETSIFCTIMDAINYGYNCVILDDVIGYVSKSEYNKKKVFLLNIGISFESLKN